MTDQASTSRELMDEELSNVTGGALPSCQVSTLLHRRTLNFVHRGPLTHELVWSYRTNLFHRPVNSPV